MQGHKTPTTNESETDVRAKAVCASFFMPSVNWTDLRWTLMVVMMMMMMMMEGLCRCIVVLHILKDWHRLQNCSNVSTQLLLASGWVRSKMVLRGFGRSLVCLFCTIATVIQIYHGGDMYEMRRRKPKPTLWATQGNFNLPHHKGMIREELPFDDSVSYT